MTEEQQMDCESPRFWPDDYALLKTEMAELERRLEIAERAVECRWRWPTYKAALETGLADFRSQHG